MIDKLRLWLIQNWIFVSVVITAVPIGIKVVHWIGKMDYIVTTTFNMSRKMKPILPKIDTIFVRQGLMRKEIHSIKLAVDSNRSETKCLSKITEKHIVKDAKTKEDLLRAIKDFGPYWNYNPELSDTIKKKLLYPGKIIGHKVHKK